jgi:hypothetical protein
MTAAAPMTARDGIIVLQVVQPASAILTKTLRKTASGEWIISGEYGNATRVRAEERPVSCLADLAAVLREVASDPKRCVIRGGLRDGFVEAALQPEGVRRRLYSRPGEPAAFEERARRWVACDLDSFDLPGFVDPVLDVDHVIDAALEQLPPAFADASFYWQLTSGHGIKPGGRVRLWFWLSRPTTNRELKIWLGGAKVDVAVFAAVQPIYTAAPLLPPGLIDFLPSRAGLRAGGCDDVEVPASDVLISRQKQGAASATVGGFVAASVEQALEAMGDPPAYPDGRGFHEPIKAAFSAAIRADGSKVDQVALLMRIDEALAERGHTRPAGYIEARSRDARRWMEWWVWLAAENDAAQSAGALDGPHYRRPHLSGEEASRRLRWVVRAWFNRVERNLEARDWIMLEAERITPEVRAKAEVRIRAKLIQSRVDPDKADEEAAIRAARAARDGCGQSRGGSLGGKK